MPPKGLESARIQIDFGGPTTPAGTTFLVEDITLVKAGVSEAVKFIVSCVNTEQLLLAAQCAVRHLTSVSIYQFNTLLVAAKH
jgi:hypothetical protein